MSRPLNVRSKVSTGNSSTTPILNGGNFTGAWEDVTIYQSLVVSALADQDGHYEVQYSSDGVTPEYSITRYFRTAGITTPHNFTNSRAFARVIFYNNSGVDQTSFSLQVLLGDKPLLNSPQDVVISKDFDSVSTRPTDYNAECVLGRREGVTVWNKMGYNLLIGTTPEIIAAWSTPLDFLTVGETISIVSSSVNDIVTTGTGARTISITGVDSNWDPQVEVVNMNGTTPVVTVTTWIGINEVVITEAGTDQGNDGDITITSVGSGYNMAQMPAGDGVTQQCLFYVPRKHQFLSSFTRMSIVKASGGGNPRVQFRGWVYDSETNAIREIFLEDVDTQISEVLHVDPHEPFLIGEKSILWYDALSSAANTAVKGRFSGKLVEDVDI
jgi:hypothetical protein